jgi:NAD(P)-dependent dehydrogenase (short-subunit alcohol dehydrogenase family)
VDPSYDFTGRAAFVTGASSGMGLATARALVAATVETSGRLDMAYNNAGIQAPVTDAADETAERFDRLTAVNLRGVWANQPIGRLGTAEEMAAAVLWLCSPGASFVVGVALSVDGGYTAR